MSLTRLPSWGGYGETIGQAFEVIPVGMRERLGHVQFVCGVDPIFAGLHSYTTVDDGRSFRDTSHCCYPHNLSGPADRRITTIVLPEPITTVTVVHELGHALHETIDFRHIAAPVTEYARTNKYEAFAEALVAWLYWYGDQDVAGTDRATVALFEELAR